MMHVGSVLLTKTAFAALINVTPARVSQMLSSGMIGVDAIAGHGRGAKIIVDRAKRQIASRRDAYQALGNGLATQLDVNTQPIPQGALVDAEVALGLFGHLLVVTLTETYGFDVDEATQLSLACWEKASELTFSMETPSTLATNGESQ